MLRKDADKWFVNNKNNSLWIMEATGSFNYPHETKYLDGMLYVLWEKGDDEVDVYDTSNIYGECEYEETLEFFNKIEMKGITK